MDERKIKREIIGWRVTGVFSLIVALGLAAVGCYLLSAPWSWSEVDLRKWLAAGCFFILGLCMLCLAVLARVAQRQEEYALYFKELIEECDVEWPREDVVKP